mmetsp:Transcript_29267/g.64129  ORF Transcript_29267/g.64129 Transcript_29267/m.64129 type:complete len:534 (-) Transcript_29267:319-1920(-)
MQSLCQNCQRKAEVRGSVHNGNNEEDALERREPQVRNPEIQALGHRSGSRRRKRGLLFLVLSLGGLAGWNRWVGDVVLVLGHGQVQEHGNEEPDAVRRGEDNENRRAQRALAIVEFGAARAVVVEAVRHRLGAGDGRGGENAAETGAHPGVGLPGESVDGARGRRRDWTSRVDVAHVGLGPEAIEEVEVQRVESEAAAGDEQLRLHRNTKTNADGEHEDERVASRQVGARELHAGDEHHREAHEHHAAHHADWDRDEGAANLAEDAEEDEPEGAREAGGARGAARERDDAVVLREGGVRWRGEEASDHRVEAVRKQAALHARVEVRAHSRNLRGHARASDVADGLGSRHKVGDEHWQEILRSEAQGEGGRPEKGDGVSTLDARVVPVNVVLAGDGVGQSTDARQVGLGVAGGLIALARLILGERRHKAAKHEGPEDESRLQERRTEELDDDGHRQHREAEADVLRRAEGQHDLAVLGAQLRPGAEGSLATRLVLRTEHAAANVLDARGDEAAADEHHRSARHHRREELLHRLR